MTGSRMSSTERPGLMPIDLRPPVLNPEPREETLSGVLIGRSLAIRRVRARILQLARTALPVLVEGPTGSGKELVAQSLHALSGRAGRLVAFNVSAVADSMFEDALFGHVRGAFTGAAADIPGYLTEADRGTVFLDEISTLPLSLQGKLLRALETREFRPVGARADQHSDFRLVAATNEELSSLVRTGRFREDLLYRIRASVIRIPSLRERVEDVRPLAVHFARVAYEDGGAAPHADARQLFSEAAFRLLEGHSWRGNIRELRHVIELAAVMSNFRPMLGASEVEEALGDIGSATSASGTHDEGDDLERRRFVGVLEECEWNAVAAARSIGISKAHMYRRMRELGIRTRGRPRMRPTARTDASAGPRDDIG